MEVLLASTQDWSGAAQQAVVEAMQQGACCLNLTLSWPRRQCNKCLTKTNAASVTGTTSCSLIDHAATKSLVRAGCAGTIAQAAVVA